MRCHYEVLGLPLTATTDEIKKAYRKCALMWHPDKHTDTTNKEEANKKFLEVQDAYETLSNDQERAWYDNHREVLINGGNPGEPGEANYTFNIYPFFSPTCFKGYGDDEKGFYSVYKEMFSKIAEEDRPYYDEETVIPEFGDSTSSYDEVVGPFYSFWLSYCTPRSFVWCEKHDTRDAGDRYIRRIMEKENKKFRDKAKKERNEEIRKVVGIVRKKDKRVEEYKKFLEEKTLMAQKKTEEKREADRLRRVEQMKTYVEPEWSAVDKKLEELDLEEKLKSIKKTNTQQQDEEKNSGDEEEEDDDEFDESLYCVACDKSFKVEKSFQNHEKSKKHKENIELLKKHMKEEDAALLFGKNVEQKNSDSNEENAASKTTDQTTKQKLSKKQKKKRKQTKNDLANFENDSSNEETVIVDIEAEQETIPIADKKETVESAVKPKKKTEKVKSPEPVEEEDESKSLKCTICETEFDSRNKLFDHINKEGHASLKQTDQPLSHNAIKKNKRLLAKINKK